MKKLLKFILKAFSPATCKEDCTCGCNKRYGFAYKAVYVAKDRLCSATVPTHRKGCVQYKIGEWVTVNPDREIYRDYDFLFVFDTLENAKAFCRNEYGYYHESLKIFFARVEWADIKDNLIHFPQGTKIAKRVKLLQEIT